MNVCAIDYSPMTESDFDWVVEHESTLHAFPWTAGNFADSLAAGYGAWIMRRDGVPVGYAVMLTVLDEAHLLNISVVKSAQGSGMGRQFMEYLYGEARRLGSQQFFLEVRPSNESALALYRQQGFEPIGRRRGYYPAKGGGREDAIVMRREL